jgi:hypothetical protein
MDVDAGRAVDAETLIFVNYRGSDAGSAAAFVHTELSQRFGAPTVFLDYESIPLGRNFQPVLFSRVRGSAVLLAIIGDRWLEGDVGQRPIDDPDDWVRREILEALRHEVPVVPVLFDGARLSVDRLPPELAVLVNLQHFEIRTRRQSPRSGHAADRAAASRRSCAPTRRTTTPTFAGGSATAASPSASPAKASRPARNSANTAG